MPNRANCISRISSKVRFKTSFEGFALIPHRQGVKAQARRFKIRWNSRKRTQRTQK
jgi:hypothetical protein